MRSAPSSQVMSSAASPFFAAPMWSATTATAFSRRTTWRTPLTALALLSSTLASLPPNTGQAATVAIFMPGSLDIDAERGCAVRPFGAVEAFGRRSDQREVLGVLERDVVRHRQRRRLVGHGAVGELAAGRHVDDRAVLRAARARVHLPGLRGRGHQHAARRGAGRGAAAPRKPRTEVEPPVHLKPEERIAIELIVWRRSARR